MSLFNTQSTSMSFTNVSEGLDIDGMNNYIKFLQLDVLQKVIDQLEKTQGIQSAINLGWQGKSRDKFLTKFEEQIKATEKELTNEFEDLKTRMNDLARSFYTQDENML